MAEVLYRHCAHCTPDMCGPNDVHPQPCPTEGCPGRMPIDPETEG